MTEPTRWLASSETPEELKSLLRDSAKPSQLPQAVRRRGLVRVSKLAPALTIFGLSLKAAATTFAASAVASSIAIVGVQELQERSAEAKRRDEAQTLAQPSQGARSSKPPGTQALPAPVPAEPAPTADRAVPSKRLEPAPEAAPNTVAQRAPGSLAHAEVVEPSGRATARGNAAATPQSATPQSATPQQLGASDRLARETSLLERARKALQSAPSTALALARQHEQEFRGGQLRAERMFIEAQALARLGRTGEAQQRARQALRQYPNGLYAERVQEFLDRLH